MYKKQEDPMSNRFAFTLFLLAAFGFESSFAAPKSAGRDEPTITIKTDYMNGLNAPWDLAFAADGTLFYTEKCAGLSVRKTDGATLRLFGANDAVMVADDFFCEGQTGMHGVALDPAFASNQTLYVYMPSNFDGRKLNHVVKLQLDAAFTQVLSREDIVKDIPFKEIANAWGNPGSHSGGRIRFGTDGYLYITTGDNHNGTIPQDLTVLGGKVLRVDTAGTAAPDNNTPAGGDARIYVYGLRNVQGITFHPTTGQAFIAEHGPNHSDEVTALVAGGNGGWDPKPEAGVTCDDNYCGYTSNKIDGTPTPMTDLVKFPDALPPVLSNDDSQGMGPITFLTGAQWKDWENMLIVGIMGNNTLQLIKIDDQNKLLGVSSPKTPAERARSIVQGPDGLLYIATDAGNIWQITPQ